LGDGRGIALSGADGSIDWWCVPNMDSPPLFDRLLNADAGGRFVVAPDAPFTATRRYRDDSNVLETVFVTAEGRAMLTESLNSGTAGRLPWAELARRVDGIEGEVSFHVEMRPGRRGDTASPYQARVGRHHVFHVADVLGLFLHDDGIVVERGDEGVTGRFSVRAGERRTLAIVAGADEPLVVPPIAEIDARIDLSDREWRDWTAGLACPDQHRQGFVRSALALKLLLYSPSGAIAAAGTTSLPERVGGTKNYDYRYAWVRDAGYVIRAFLAAGLQAEAKAALAWLLDRLEAHGACVCFTLGGERVPGLKTIDAPGWRGSAPVVTGNVATDQTQHGVYGDIFETAAHFVGCGNILDPRSAETLSHLADRCADAWRTKDAGIWELPEQQHYTGSKISCWQALARAVELADQGQLPTTCRDRWARERDRIAGWIDEHCWSEARGAYTFYPGTDRLDASLALAVRFGFPGGERLCATLDAIDRGLGRGAYHYRYSGAEREEGCFLACTFWMIEARAVFGEVTVAEAALADLLAALDRGVGVWTEMADPDTGAFLGNMPQGLTHLAHILALDALGTAQAG